MLPHRIQAKMRGRFYRRLRANGYIVHVDVRLMYNGGEKPEKYIQDVAEYLQGKQSGHWINSIEELASQSAIKTMAVLDYKDYISTIKRLSTARWTELPRMEGVITIISVHWSEPTQLKAKVRTHKKKFRYHCEKCGASNQFGGELIENVS